jgi:hypothetical protein
MWHFIEAMVLEEGGLISRREECTHSWSILDDGIRIVMDSGA